MLARGNQEARERELDKAGVNPINFRTSYQACPSVSWAGAGLSGDYSDSISAPCMPIWSWKLSCCCSPLWNGIVVTFAVQEHLITPMLSLNLAASNSNNNNNNNKTANLGYLSKTCPVQQASDIMIYELPIFRQMTSNQQDPILPWVTNHHLCVMIKKYWHMGFPISSSSDQETSEINFTIIFTTVKIYRTGITVKTTSAPTI